MAVTSEPKSTSALIGRKPDERISTDGRNNRLCSDIIYTDLICVYKSLFTSILVLATVLLEMTFGFAKFIRCIESNIY